MVLVELLDYGVAFVLVLTMGNLGAMYHLSTRVLDLRAAVMTMANGIESYAATSTHHLDDTIGAVTSAIGSEIESTIHGVLGEMHVPTAADQLTGGLMQMGTMWLQSKLMRDMPEGVMSMLQGQAEQPEG